MEDLMATLQFEHNYFPLLVLFNDRQLYVHIKAISNGHLNS